MLKTNRKIFLYVLIILSLMLAACGGGEENATPEAGGVDIFEDFTPVVSATGKVVPHEWATLSTSTGGIVGDILVEENDVVKEGDVLLRINGREQMDAAIAATNLELVSAEQALKEIESNADITDAQALQAIANARDALRDAEIRIGSLNEINDPEDVANANARVILTKDAFDKATTYWKNFENKPESNVKRAEALTVYNQAKDAYEAALRTWNYIKGGSNDIDLAQGAADLAYAKALLAKVQSDYEELEGGIDPDMLALAQARVNNAEKQLAAAQAARDNLEVTAPFSGTVAQIFIRESESVGPGQPVVILGDLSNLQVETTDLNEIDVARIKVGSKATITFDALPDVEVEAEVVRIATKSSPGTGVNYTVILVLHEVPENLLWDMTAFIDIEINE